MLNVTEAAQKEVAAYFEGKEVQPVRVFLGQGCGGSMQFAMALDEKKDGDAVYEFAGIKYVIEKDLIEKAQPVEVDFQGLGFKISSSLELGGGCSSCGSGNSCGS